MDATQARNEAFFTGRRVLVTGACGTIGRELVRQLLHEHQAAEVIALDNNESELFFLEQQFDHSGRMRSFVGDVRDRDKLGRKMENVNIVFHTAAYKHVTLCERSPMEAVQTNILGVQNVIYAACDNKVEKVIFTSSDKAVNPTSVMGTSKLMGERLITAANSNLLRDGTVFASTRFGNVLGSRGSVIPIFREQIRRGGPVTLTDPGMTRFIMSIREAVRLVVDSARLALGGEVFITKMPVIRVEDLARVMIRELAPESGYDPGDIEIEVIGMKPGEKLYEELMSQEETRRAVELERYFVVLPAFRCLYRSLVYDYPERVSETVTNPYHSGNETPLDQEKLTEFLLDNGLLREDADRVYIPSARYWPDDSKLEAVCRQ